MSQLLDVEGMTKRFGGLTAVDQLTLTLDGDGPFWGLVGPNGSGKSTLFNCIAGIHRPDAGVARLRGIALPQGNPRKVMEHGLARTFQSPRVFSAMSVADNLLAAGRHCADPEERMWALLGLVELEALAYRTAGELSIGQQKLVELARALMPEPSIVLLDEMGAGIHPRLLGKIEEYLWRLADTGVRFLLVEHNMAFISRLCTHLFVLESGALLASGTPREVLSDPLVAAAYLGQDLGGDSAHG